jgi:hypothetical protein
MRLHLASFLEPKNFGTGRVIGIANGNKPDNIRCDVVFEPLVPTTAIMERYNDMKVAGSLDAGTEFVSSFKAQLEAFAKTVQDKAELEGKTPQEILPFKDGDTLASWERESFTNYRSLIVPFLEELGFEVELH